MENKNINYKSHILIQKFDDGYYAECPALEGCYTQGFTHEQAVENIKDAIKLHILDRVQSGEEIPSSTPINWAEVKESISNSDNIINYSNVDTILQTKGFVLKRTSEKHRLYQNKYGKRITVPLLP